MLQTYLKHTCNVPTLNLQLVSRRSHKSELFAIIIVTKYFHDVFIENSIKIVPKKKFMWSHLHVTNLIFYAHMHTCLPHNYLANFM